MMDFLRAGLLLATAIIATVLVLERGGLRQILILNLLGLVLGLLFFAFQAPDAAMAELVVGMVAQPLVFLSVLARLHRPAIPKQPGEAGESRVSPGKRGEESDT
jgi:energy-converting hydrogenase B subunit D